MRSAHKFSEIICARPRTQRTDGGGSGLDLSTCVVEPLPARWPFPCSLSRTCIIYRRVSNINYSALDTRALSPALRASVSMKIRLPLSDVLPKAARSFPKFTVTREFPIATQAFGRVKILRHLFAIRGTTCVHMPLDKIRKRKWAEIRCQCNRRSGLLEGYQGVLHVRRLVRGKQARCCIRSLLAVRAENA